MSLKKINTVLKIVMYTPVSNVIVLKTRIHFELNTVEFIVVEYIYVTIIFYIFDCQ